MIALIRYYRFYFTYFNIHGSEDTQTMQVVHGAGVWGQGCEDTSSRGVDWLSVLQSCPVHNTTHYPAPCHPHPLVSSFHRQTGLQASGEEKDRALCQWPAGMKGRGHICICSRTPSLVHSFILSFLGLPHWFTHSFFHSLDSLIGSLINSFIP